MDEVILANGSKLLIHTREVCTPPCAFHEPSNHPLNNAPIHWRDDIALLERVCRHGIGHPDPDDVAYQEEHFDVQAKALSVHGCDGCCVKK